MSVTQSDEPCGICGKTGFSRPAIHAAMAHGVKRTGPRPQTSPSDSWLYKANRHAEETLQRGGWLTIPHRSPYRLLARTCPQCREIVTTPDHLIHKDAKGKSPECPGCLTRIVRQQQAETLPTASNWGKQWTGPEYEVAARLDLSVLEKARLLGRTVYAVKTAMARLQREPSIAWVAGISRDVA